MELQQLPPHNNEAELSLLGSIFVDPEIMYQIKGDISYKYFYNSVNGLIFKAMLELYDNNQAIDYTTLGDKLKNEIDDVDDKLITLLNVATMSINFKAYAKIVKGNFARRRLIRAGGHIATLAYDESIDTSDVLSQSLAKINIIASHGQSNEQVPFRKQLENTLDLIQDRANGDIKSIKTGFSALDELIVGIEVPELVIIGARPGVGKTALMLTTALHMATSGHCVAFFNWEMTYQQVISRMISSKANVPGSKIKSGNLSMDDWRDIQVAMGELDELSLTVADNWQATPESIELSCQKIIAKKGKLDIVFIDYLGLMNPNKKLENRNADVSAISRYLKLMAGRLGIPIIAASQLNRGVEHRSEKRPTLSDLRDSGSIEQDADQVWFLYRNEGDAELIVAKNRSGETGTVLLKWLGPYTKFDNLSYDKNVVQLNGNIETNF